MVKHSAGIVLFTIVEGDPRILLVHPGSPYWSGKDAGAWSIPKGEYSPSEDSFAAALREFHEETGTRLTGEHAIELGDIRQRGGKIVRAWAIERDFAVAEFQSNLFAMEWPPKSGHTRHFPEIDRARWCTPATARSKMNPAQVELIDRLLRILEERGRINPA